MSEPADRSASEARRDKLLRGRGVTDETVEQIQLARDLAADAFQTEREARESQLPEPATLAPVCELHDWNPRPPMPGAPRPPCPFCLKVRDARRTPEEEASIESPILVEHKVPERYAVFWDRHQSRRRRAGHVLPRSLEEREALDRIDAKREKEMVRENETAADRQRRYQRAQARILSHDPAKARYA